MKEDKEEADEEADVGEFPPTGDLAPEQAPVLRAILPVAPRFWAVG